MMRTVRQFCMAGMLAWVATGAHAQLTEIKVSYQPALYWALPFYVASEKGWWTELGLKPTFSTFPAGVPQIAASASKSWDVGGTGSVPAVLGAARETGAAIPVLSVADTLKRLGDGLIEATVSRDSLGAAQTPQAASLGILLAALDAAGARAGEPTDEAAALTAIGVPVRAVAGDPANRKLTEDGDLPVLRAILRDRSVVAIDAPAMGARTGIGFDAHRLEFGVPLKMGGLVFPDEPRGLAGHSDGDVALHAVIDALLGAAHLGDVGTHFAEGDEHWSGADSGELLRLAVERIRDAGFRARTVDLTIVAARPAIARAREAMERRIAELTGLPARSVSVKGTTSDGLGFAGTEGIAAYAVASVEQSADASPTDGP